MVSFSVELEVDWIGDGLTGVFLTGVFVAGVVPEGFDAAETGILTALGEGLAGDLAVVAAVVLLTGAFLTGVTEAGFCAVDAADTGFLVLAEEAAEVGFDGIVDCTGFLTAGDGFFGVVFATPVVAGLLIEVFEDVVPSFFGVEPVAGFLAP
jgi:hypothetical protein